MSEIRYPMKMVLQRTGLSAHVVRVWERRYEAVSPDRTGTNRRLYTEEEMRRLELLAILTRSGHSIGQIAQQDTASLEALVQALQEAPASTASAQPQSGVLPARMSIEWFSDKAWAAVESLDAAGLEEVFDRASREIGGSGMIEKLIVPLIVKIGDRWDSGEISVAQERAASTVIQEILLLAGRPHSETRGAPNLIVATPVGQLHELGAALVVCTARRRGWAVTYLGASIPAEEIAHAASVKGSPAVALSIVYPSDDQGLSGELKRLRRLLPENCHIVAGGRAATGYAGALEEIGAQQFSGLWQLKAWLDEERETRASANGDQGR